MNPLTAIRLWLKDFVPGWDEEDLQRALDKVAKAKPGATVYLTQRQLLAFKSAQATRRN